MTTRLYYTDAYLLEFEARITAAAEDGRRVYLDRTAFYPTSGGQPFDTGMLAGVPIVDVVDEVERVAHLLAGPIGAETGATVEGRVDRERRFDHMQQHTGQHLLSAAFADLFGLETVSVHFGADAATLDLRVESIDPERLVEAERRANAIVWENRPVTVSFEDADAGGLRNPASRDGTLRIVTIDGIDRSACGGTHVAATGEIGPILLRRVERIRRETRVEFLCGGRAVGRARADYDALARTAAALSAGLDEVPDLVAAQREQAREALAARKRLEQELAAFRAGALYDATPPDAAGLRRVVVRRAGAAADEIRALAQAIVARPLAVVVAAVDEPPVVLLAASEDAGIDAGAELRRVLGVVGGRGGGSTRLAQGSVPTRDALDRALAELGV